MEIFEKYDSTADTLRHIKRVNQLLTMGSIELLERGIKHDSTKLTFPEKELFDEFTPKLKNSTYGSEEYMGFLGELKVALDHHYANNPHHPEYHENGINDMDLFDIIEMLMDWKAASERHSDGNIYTSIYINKDRFKISEQMVNIMLNTARKLGW